MAEQQHGETTRQDQNEQKHPLQRDVAEGMNPVTLLTGFFGARGERIRHRVHEGALRLPAVALDMYAESGSVRSDKSTFIQKEYKLPGLDSVVRPSVDPSLSQFTVTQVHKEDFSQENVSPEDGSIQIVVFSEMISKNVVIVREQDKTQRIRGGGDEEGVADATPNHNSHLEAHTQPDVSHIMAQERLATAPAATAPAATAPEATASAAPASAPPASAPPASAPPAPAPPAPAPPAPAPPAPAPTAPTPTAPFSLEEVPTAPAVAPSDTIPTSMETSEVEDLAASAVFRSKPTSPTSMETSEVEDSAAVPTTKPSTPTPMETSKGEGIAGSSALISKPVAPRENAQPLNETEGRVPPAENQFAVSVPTYASPPVVIVAITSAVNQPSTANVPPTTVSSSATAGGIEQEAQVLPLKKRPAPQWEQHMPGTNDEMQIDVASKTAKPDWYNADKASTLERALLPEWFDESAAHRTPESYVQTREKIVEISAKLGHNRYVTGTMVRRAIPGDAGSLLRLHAFLTSYAFINEDAINDTAPTPFVFQKKSLTSWSDDSVRASLMHAVVEQAQKRHKMTDASDFVPINWAAVAASVGQGMTPSDCERQFLIMPIVDDTRDGSITPDTSTGGGDHRDADHGAAKSLVQQELLKDLVDNTDPAVISTVTKVALCTTNNLSHAQNAGAVGLVARRALEDARTQEGVVSRILAEVVDVRMKKLENRMALLDDVEGMLEAERIALELERRDLYTARCRHWFGGT